MKTRIFILLFALGFALFSCSKSEYIEPIVPIDPPIDTVDPVDPPVNPPYAEVFIKGGFYSPVPSVLNSGLKSLKASQIDSIAFDTIPEELMKNLVLFMPLDSNAFDTINKVEANVISGVTFESTEFNDVLDSTYIEIPENELLDFIDKQYSICIWFNNDGRIVFNVQGLFGRQKSPIIFEEDTIGGGESALFVQLATVKDWSGSSDLDYDTVPRLISYNPFYVDGKPASLVQSGDSYEYVDDALLTGWHFVVMIGDANDPYFPIASLDKKWIIARECDYRADTSASSRFFYGALDQVMMFDKQLSVDEIMELYSLKRE